MHLDTHADIIIHVRRSTACSEACVAGHLASLLCWVMCLVPRGEEIVLYLCRAQRNLSVMCSSFALLSGWKHQGSECSNPVALPKYDVGLL